MLSQLSYAPHSNNRFGERQGLLYRITPAVSTLFFVFFKKFFEKGNALLSLLFQIGDHGGQILFGKVLHPVTELAGEFSRALLVHDLFKLL